MSVSILVAVNKIVYLSFTTVASSILIKFPTLMALCYYELSLENIYV